MSGIWNLLASMNGNESRMHIHIVHAHVLAIACTYVHTHVMYILTYTRMYVCTYVCMYTQQQPTFMQADTHTHTHTNTLMTRWSAIFTHKVQFLFRFVV